MPWPSTGGRERATAPMHGMTDRRSLSTLRRGGLGRAGIRWRPWSTEPTNGWSRRRRERSGRPPRPCAAKILSAAGLETRGAVQAALTDPVQQETSPLKQEWRSLPGQSSALTWTYFLMLNGIPGVKADRMVLRYVSAATAEEVSAKDAAALVREVATRIGESATVLDHAIWRHQSGRPVEQVMPDTVGPVTSETGALPAQASSGIEDTEEAIITDA